MGLHTSGHTRKNSGFSTQDEHLVLLGLEALTDGPQPPLRNTLYLQTAITSSGNPRHQDAHGRVWRVQSDDISVSEGGDVL